MRKAASLALIAVLLVGCGPAETGRSITVVLELSVGNARSITQTQDGCTGAGGYSDISEGVQFTVKDASDALIGFGAMTDSRYVDAFHCTFEGHAEVSDSAIYSVEVGRRGAVLFNRSDLEANGWRVELSLGS